MTPTFTRPAEGEYAPFYAGYVARVGDGELIEQMEAQVEEVSRLLRGLSEDAAMARYEPGKWSVKEVAGHLADAERVMSYRALRVARGDQTPLAGFDENAFVAGADFDAALHPRLVPQSPARDARAHGEREREAGERARARLHHRGPRGAPPGDPAHALWLALSCTSGRAISSRGSRNRRIIKRSSAPLKRIENAAVYPTF